MKAKIGRPRKIQAKIPTWMKVLSFIAEGQDVTLKDVKKHTGFSYNHIINTVNILERNDFVTTKKVGRFKELVPTSQAKQLVHTLDKMANIA